ncbi:MAG: phospholipase D/Transphosphatidylase [Acidobacteriales bacterium]|nr:phospholipase D/Transphosphatidylase [Terriglobales bacterium]
MNNSPGGQNKLHVFAIVALIFLAAWLILTLFQPQMHYRVQASSAPLESQEFWWMLESVTDARLQQHNKIQVLPNGENFYKAELATIAQAQHSVNIEAYIFQKGEVAQKFIDSLTERARNGVKVKLVIDALGSFSNSKEYFKSLTDAGGEVNWYHPLRWYNWDRANNRTHRELMVIDGKKAFIGGAGIADHWLNDKGDKKRWRDTMVLIEGPAVSALQGTFVENWLESSGQIISGIDYFPLIQGEGSSPAMVVNSTASQGGSTRARVLFQALLASSKSTIYMSSPYFLPDGDVRDELVRAVKRGVSVKIITPGKSSDHAVTRSSSRRLYGDLLQNGVQIYEYQPTMIHAKILVVDGKWSVVGSTNMDNRSFQLNDEVNLAAFDGDMSRRLTEDFMNDLQASQLVTYEDWKKRPILERLTESLGAIIQREQ